MSNSTRNISDRLYSFGDEASEVRGWMIERDANEGRRRENSAADTFLSAFLSCQIIDFYIIKSALLSGGSSKGRARRTPPPSPSGYSYGTPPPRSPNSGSATIPHRRLWKGMQLADSVID